MNTYGHPTGRPIPRRDLYHYGAKARRVFDSNPDHPGLIQATAELQQLLDGAQAAVAEGRPSDGATRHLAKLAGRGATPLDILTMLSAVMLYDREDGGRLLRNPTMYRFAVAKAVTDLIPKPELKERSKTLSALGDLLVDRYAVLAGAVAQALDERGERERARKAAMSTPFNPIPTNNTKAQ